MEYPLRYGLEVTGKYFGTKLQVHHGGAGTTATGLKAGVIDLQ